MTLEELIKMRRDCDLTQSDMAEEFGLSRRAYIDIENGKVPFRRVYELAAERIALHFFSLGDIDWLPLILNEEVRDVASFLRTENPAGARTREK